MTYEILGPRPGIEFSPRQWKHRALTIGPPGSAHPWHFFCNPWSFLVSLDFLLDTVKADELWGGSIVGTWLCGFSSFRSWAQEYYRFVLIWNQGRDYNLSVFFLILVLPVMILSIVWYGQPTDNFSSILSWVMVLIFTQVVPNQGNWISNYVLCRLWVVTRVSSVTPGLTLHNYDRSAVLSCTQNLLSGSTLLTLVFYQLLPAPLPWAGRKCAGSKFG